MDTKGIGFSVVIEAKWMSTKERIRLDYGPGNKLIGALSSENWGEDGGVVNYSPRVLSSAFDDGHYSVELAYFEQDHVPLSSEILKNVYWGKTRLSFRVHGEQPTFKMHDMRWTGDGSRSEELDGPPKKVTIRPVVPSKQRKASVQVREGQRKFKEQLWLLEKKPSCAISGETMRELLDAAHIIPVAEGGSDEVENGLLLRADIHRLFDAGYFQINLDGSLKMKRLKGLPMSYREHFEKWSAQKVKLDVMRRIQLSLKKKLQASKAKGV